MKKKDRKYLYAVIAVLILLLFLCLWVFTPLGSIITGEYLDNRYDGTGTGDADTDASGTADDASDDDNGDDDDGNGNDVIRTFTGGGVIDPEEDCTRYDVDDDLVEPYLFFSYTASWDERYCDCQEQTIIWCIYEDATLIKTITQTEPGSGQTYIRNYDGGDITVCVSQSCWYDCPVTVSWTLQIID
jgi:hypothetical protein